MKANRYIAILVFLGAAAWIVTGEFAFVGSASSEDGAQSAETAAEETTTEDAAQKVQTVGVAVIPQVDHARSVRVSGVTQADKTTSLTARTGGIIGELNIRQGDRVEKGEVIAKIAPEGRDTAVRSAEQLLEQRKAEAEAAERLGKQGTLPKLQVDSAMSALRQAESQLETAKVELEKLDITAPYGGVVDELEIEEGASVQAGTVVAKLISLDPIVGVGEVNESDLGVVKVGEDANLRLVNGLLVTGKITYISRAAQDTTRTYTVEVEAANPDLAIPAGMTAELILRGDDVLATPVPRSVVALNDAGELGVRTVDDDNKVAFHPIDIVDDSTGALILGGIPKGARVIVTGQNFVTEGDTVDPVEADGATVNRLIEEAKAGAI